jgi:hypothetical protein
MKTPKTAFEFRYKVKVKNQKAKLFWSIKPFGKQHPIFNELISKGFEHVGTYRINPKKHTAGFKKKKQFSKKVLTVDIIRLPIRRQVIKNMS